MVVLAIRRELEKAQVKLRHPRPQQQQQQQQAVQQSTTSQHDAALLTALRSRLAALSQEELTELLNEEDEEGGVEGEGGLDTLLAGLRTDFPALGETGLVYPLIFVWRTGTAEILIYSWVPFAPAVELWYCFKVPYSQSVLRIRRNRTYVFGLPGSVSQRFESQDPDPQQGIQKGLNQLF
jgi:hypothetical protein